MLAGPGGGIADGLLEEPGGGGAAEGQDSCPTEDIDISQQRGLLLHQAINLAQGAVGRTGRAVTAQVAGDGGGFLL